MAIQAKGTKGVPARQSQASRQQMAAQATGEMLAHRSSHARGHSLSDFVGLGRGQFHNASRRYAVLVRVKYGPHVRQHGNNGKRLLRCPGATMMSLGAVCVLTTNDETPHTFDAI